jgi:transposase
MGKDFLNYEGWTATNFEVGAGVITVDAVIESAPAGCLSCGRLAICLDKHGPKEREIADIPVRGARVVIRLKRQRYICSSCGATTFQPLPGVTGTKRLTDRLASYIATKAVTEPFAKVAKETGLSPKKIRTVFVEFAARELRSRNIETPYSLGIDDVYVDRVARCVLADNDTHGLYDLLTRRNMTFLNRFLLNIPNRHQVKVVTIDMCAPFRDAVRNALPNAVVVVDRFHIQRFANDAAKHVAKSVKPRKKSVKGFTRDRFLLLHDPEELNDTQKANKDLWLKHEPLVYQAYALKQAYLNIWKIRDRGQAEAAYDDWLVQIPDELKEAFRKLTTAMKNWRAEVFNFWEHHYTNATCESHNRIIKDVQRTGQSYDFETVRAKVLLRDSQKQRELKIAVNVESTPAPLNEIRSITQGSRTISNTKATTKESRGQVGFNTKILDPEA